jgi:HSP20 family protein
MGKGSAIGRRMERANFRLATGFAIPGQKEARRIDAGAAPMEHELIRLTRRLALTRRDRLMPTRWLPPADLYKTPDGWLLKLEMAGVAPEAISVQVCGRWITVQGHRRDTLLTEGHTCYSMEITYSAFQRTLELPIDLDRAHVSSEYEHGMLLVTIKPEVRQP